MTTVALGVAGWMWLSFAPPSGSLPPPPAGEVEASSTPASTPQAPSAPPSTVRRADVTPPPPSGSAGGSERSGAGTDDPEADQAPPMDLSRTWNFARTSAPPQPRYVGRAETPVRTGAHPVGFYSGVSVQGGQIPPKAPMTVGVPPAQVTWTGFERVPGGSQVFIQLSAPSAYTTTQTGTRITLRLENTRASTRNNLRPLDLRYFKTPVKTVALSSAGPDIVATIDLKTPATPAVEIKRGENGYHLIVLRFSEGAAPAATPPAVSPGS